MIRNHVAASLLICIILGCPATGVMAREQEASRFTSPTLEAEFVLIPSGTFLMGSPPGASGRHAFEKQHLVTISEPFYMQTTEVTQRQWTKVMESNPSHFVRHGDSCPVESVSWHDVQDFIDRLNSMEGTTKYRLPTEAQWEYAARAGTKTRFHSGDSDADLSQVGWYVGNSYYRTHAVAQKVPNAWGLYDMHGNVSEWCRDFMGSYPSDHVTDPQGPSAGPDRVYRGGSWDRSAWACRSVCREHDDPRARYNFLGFRLMRTQ